MGRKPSKSETLTIRLDPKTRFMLEFVSRLRGQSITVVVERAIAMAADHAIFSEDGGFRSSETIERSWRDFWSVNEGERALKIAGEAALHPQYDEERRLAFAKKHWAFFYTSEKTATMRSAYLEILWPRIDEFVALDEEKKAENYWAAAQAMQQAIKAAGVEPPVWPPKVEPKRPSANAPAFEPGGMDDDIPF